MLARSVEFQFGLVLLVNVDHPATHLTKRWTIDAAQCATRATKFVIGDRGLFEYRSFDTRDDQRIQRSSELKGFGNHQQPLR